ncbi:Acylphosphatase-1 [Mactra antiquata]
MATGATLISVDFEIFGRVQGVFFRRDTKRAADKYKLVGWVKNTNSNTVLGHVEGPTEKISQMKHWLSEVGSKRSVIKRAEFRNEKKIEECTTKGFDIVD